MGMDMPLVWPGVFGPPLLQQWPRGGLRQWCVNGVCCSDLARSCDGGSGRADDCASALAAVPHSLAQQWISGGADVGALALLAVPLLARATAVVAGRMTVPQLA
jgi:hypothetical protein